MQQPSRIRNLFGVLFLNLVGCAAPTPPVPAPPKPVARPSPPASRPAPATIRLTILSTNDLHGQLEPLRRYTVEDAPRAYRIGGAEALAATVAELRARNPEGTLLLDAGDFMQGSLLANHYEGEPIRELFGLLRYDAVAIGNHEFDYGPVGVPDPPADSGADPRGALRAFCAAAPFPVLSANLKQSDGAPLPWKNLQGTAMVRRGRLLVGLIGLTTAETAITTMPVYAEGLRFEPWLPVVRAEARALRARGAHVVLVIAHGNAECPRSDPRSCRGELFADLLDKLEPGLVDAVVAGHSHQPIATRYRGVLVAEACSRGQVVGQMELVLDGSTRRVLPAESRLVRQVHVCHDVFGETGDCVPASGQVRESPLLAKHAALVEQVRKKLARYREGVGEGSRRLLARAARPLLHYGAGLSQTGALFARALLASVAGADAALFNGGSIRADLPSGPIHYPDLYEAFPFDNRVATVKLTGAQLTAVVRQLLGRHGMPVVAGLQLRVRCGPPRELVSILDARGRPLQPRRAYTLVLSDFLLTGGDGLGPLLDPVPAARKRIYRDRLIREVIAKYLEGRSAPINSDEDPVFSPARPPVVVEDGPCHRRARPPERFCR